MPDVLLQIRNLSKTYLDRKGKELKKALQNVSLDIYQGEILALLGVNGAGKTTLSSIVQQL
jgi:oligopeptide transport system ATP-binding protein